MQKFTRNTYEFVKQGLLQIQDEITKGERVCATRALKGIIGTMAPNREALLGYAYVRVRNRVGSKYGNTNRRAEIIAEKVQILMEAFWSSTLYWIQISMVPNSSIHPARPICRWRTRSVLRRWTGS